MCKELISQAYKNIGENIRKARVHEGFSQEELAFKLNTARNYISCIERAEKKASIAFLVRICCALDIKLESLFKGI